MIQHRRHHKDKRPMLEEGARQGVPLTDRAFAVHLFQAAESRPRMGIVPAPDPKVGRVSHKERRLHKEIPGSFFGEKFFFASMEATGTVQK